MSSPTRVPLICGAGSFGAVNSGVTRIHTIHDAQKHVELFIDRGHKYIDTSRIYGKGTSEELLGQLDLKGGRIDTKNLPTAPGAHAPEKLRATLEESQKALGSHKIHTFYLHAPDRSVPFEDTLREVDKLHKEGYFEEFGLSNFNSWEVAEIVGISKINGWIQPAVYQGLYNAVERQVEAELIPCLRKFGIRFYAYSPLAGGLLTGKYLSADDLGAKAGTRWDTTTFAFAQLLHERYVPLLPVFRELGVELGRHNISPTAAAQRWLQHHSVLGPTDGVIIGNSSLEQLKTNLDDSEGGPLPEGIVKLFDEAWKKAKGQAPHYAH